MIKSLCVLGRQPSIGVAEIESIYGSSGLSLLGEDVVGLEIEVESVAFERLGGTIKLCSIIGQIDGSDWNEIEHELISNVESYVPSLPSGKLQLGLSIYGFSASLKQIQTTALKLKQVLKSSGQSVRVVPNQALQLSSAQVLHNRLHRDKGLELIIARDGDGVLVARTTAVQNINSYTQRDRGRPKRDSRVGMLPPKLAQIIVNLSRPDTDGVVLDPFCGTGVVLQEAALMGYAVYGTDIEERMIEYSQTNLEWAKNNFGKPESWTLEVADATVFKWKKFDSVASEVYLGQPFSAFPSTDKLHSVINTCNKITENFLTNLGVQLTKGTRICLAIPAWQKPGESSFYHLPLLDHLGSLGYNRISFSHARNQDLIYYRPGQIVGRELLIITRN